MIVMMTAMMIAKMITGTAIMESTGIGIVTRDLILRMVVVVSA